MVNDLFVKKIVVDAISSKNYNVVVLNIMFIILGLNVMFVAISTLIRGIKSELLLLGSVKLAQNLIRC